MNSSPNIDAYISTFPEDVQVILQKIREIIHEEVPEAIEKISYQIPAFNLNGKYFIYFAGWKEHVSLYPVPKGDTIFQKEIAPYIGGKGTLKFSLSKPIPYDLIRKIVLVKLKEEEEK